MTSLEYSQIAANYATIGSFGVAVFMAVIGVLTYLALQPAASIKK